MIIAPRPRPPRADARGIGLTQFRRKALKRFGAKAVQSHKKTRHLCREVSHKWSPPLFWGRCGSQSFPIGFLVVGHSVLLSGRSLPRGFSPSTIFLQLTGSISFIQFLDILAISRVRTVVERALGCHAW